MAETNAIAAKHRSEQQRQQVYQEQHGHRGRIAWVDYAKAFAIIGVFLLHSAAPSFLLSVIGSSAMMLFFLLSGLVFSIRRHPRFLPFAWHRVRTLLIPGLFLAVVPFLIERVIVFCSGGTGRLWSTSGTCLGILSICAGMKGLAPFPGF